MKFAHWALLLTAEHKRRFGLRTSYKLTETHLHPSKLQKMDVTLAYQVIRDYIMMAESQQARI